MTLSLQDVLEAFDSLLQRQGGLFNVVDVFMSLLDQFGKYLALFGILQDVCLVQLLSLELGDFKFFLDQVKRCVEVGSFSLVLGDHERCILVRNV